MDNVVYLDYKAKELEHLKSGQKTMIIRGAMGRKLPYGRVNKGDVLYFVENKGDGLIKGKAFVESVFNSEKLTKEQSVEMVEKNQDKLFLAPGQKKRFSGKRYLVLITIKDFKTIEPFQIDRSDYVNMDDWLPVENIEKVKINLLTELGI
ncbi:hypothetical protein D1164_18925 [Mariniphaga sediminis]|uniref:EVE domain-containing protein n=1 Tax=Mariniphaga sediminis TaxID=1628158 RepID=A0A399CV21_9BACT|nr:hypothetical protein [Mariniphaga sediminis]RIH63654.1 hypothetical protein D1164_18925 [Mariniphaga sediminis]